jgi:hypothetical protein
LLKKFNSSQGLPKGNKITDKEQTKKTERFSFASLWSLFGLSLNSFCIGVSIGLFSRKQGRLPGLTCRCFEFGIKLVTAKATPLRLNVLFIRLARAGCL